MRYRTFSEVLHIHQGVIALTGGSPGLRDLGGLESAIAQPRITFGGSDLYPGLAEKAAALCYSLCGNHPFVDGNKRVAHASRKPAPRRSRGTSGRHTIPQSVKSSLHRCRSLSFPFSLETL